MVWAIQNTAIQPQQVPTKGERREGKCKALAAWSELPIDCYPCFILSIKVLVYKVMQNAPFSAFGMELQLECYLWPAPLVPFFCCSSWLNTIYTHHIILHCLIRSRHRNDMWFPPPPPHHLKSKHENPAFNLGSRTPQNLGNLRAGTFVSWRAKSCYLLG